MAKQTKAFPYTIIAAMAAFLALGLGLVALTPTHSLLQYFNWIGVDENRLKLGVTAYCLLVLTAFVLWVAKKALKLPVAWFLYALVFNGLIVFIKFIFSPNNYGKLAPSTLAATAVGVGLLYLVGLTLIYLFFQGKILKSLQATTKTSEEMKLLFAAGLFVFVNVLRVVLFSFTPLSKTATATYLGSIFQGGGFVLSALLFLIVLAAVEAFSRAQGDKTTLRNMFILAASMIVLYQVLWVIFVHGLALVGACSC